MLLEISKNLGKCSVNHRLPAAEQTTKKKYIYKTLIKLRFGKINPRKKFTSSHFVKLNPRKMLKKLPAKLPRENFSP